MPVLDTSFIIDFLRGHRQATRLMELLAQGSTPPSVVPLTIFELYHGIGLASRPVDEEQKISRFLDKVLPIGIEPAAARMAGLLLAQMEQRGRPISVIDLLIGCAAIHEGQPVVTRDRGGFEEIPGLEVLHY